MTLSFVIPVFNRAHLIGRCLESISRCPSRFRSEIVVVDDGSTDNICEVVTHWQAVCPKGIVFVRSERNGGVSRARNLAFPHLSGDYVWFVDSDDVVFSDGVERMMPFLDLEHPDIYRFSWCRIRAEEKATLTRPPSSLAEPERVDLQMASADDLNRFYGCSLLWNAVYRREILAGIRFLPGLANGEDGLFARTVLLAAKTMIYDGGNIAYGYTFTPGSANTIATAKMFRGLVRYSCEQALLLSNAAKKDARWTPVLLDSVWGFYPRLLSRFGTEMFRNNTFRFVRVAYYRIFVSNRFRSRASRFCSYLVWLFRTKWAMLAEYRIHAFFSTRLSAEGRRKRSKRSSNE